MYATMYKQPWIDVTIYRKYRGLERFFYKPEQQITDIYFYNQDKNRARHFEQEDFFSKILIRSIQR